MSDSIYIVYVHTTAVKYSSAAGAVGFWLSAPSLKMTGLESFFKAAGYIT